MNTPHIVHGIGRTGRYIREEIAGAQSSADAIRRARLIHPDAEALGCRPLPHVERVLEVLADRPVADRVAA